MPVWRDGRLEPRPFTLRLFLARAAGGWQVMPGGFVRVANDLDARAVSLQRGGSTGDAWVLSDRPVAPTTLLPTPERIAITRATGPLPSRAAANLFWLARYVERAEATLRLLRALINRAGDSEAAGVVERVAELLGVWGAVPTDLPNARPALLAVAALQRRDLEGALWPLVAAAQSAASVIRDRFSPDAWRALTDLNQLIASPLDHLATESMIGERIDAALRIVASFSGLAQENMSQLAGWRFLELGRRIERAIATCRVVRQLAFAAGIEGTLDALLELADSQITYRLRYVMVAAPAPVIDLVALDPANPRAIVYQLARIESHLAALPKHAEEGRLSPPEQIATALAARLRTAEAAALDAAAFESIEETLMQLSDVITTTYFTGHERAQAGWEALG